uniref:SH3 domain-containing protein n=1 Tax=Nothoprocta perdicaria TaxID=30464 RepID=A0A8C6YP24_NOTPE
RCCWCCRSERARWIAALGKSRELLDTDRTSDLARCFPALTQVEIIRTYTAKQADELSLQVADVVLVYQKVNDGWYEGERLRDGERGWFPMECAKEITCRATLDKNMERMGRTGRSCRGADLGSRSEQGCRIG